TPLLSRTTNLGLLPSGSSLINVKGPRGQCLIPPDPNRRLRDEMSPGSRHSTPVLLANSAGNSTTRKLSGAPASAERLTAKRLREIKNLFGFLYMLTLLRVTHLQFD